MDVLVRISNGEAEVSIRVDGTDATLADVVEQVSGRTAPSILFVDGRAVPATTMLGSSGVLVGSTIATADDAAPQRLDGVVELVQVAGPGAASRVWLSPGTYRIGPGRRVSAPELDLAPVDDTAFEIHVGTDATVTLTASALRTRLDGNVLADGESIVWNAGIVDAGGRAFRLIRRDGATARSPTRRFSAVGVDGTAAFNRPPRPAEQAPPAPLNVPDGGKEVRDARLFPLLAMLAPIPIAVVMAVVLGSPRFMLFGLMSPVMAAANWLGERRQRKRDAGESSSADRAAVETFTTDARARRDADRERARRSHPDLATGVDLARRADPALWQRRPGDPDVFQFPIGLADLPWTPALERTSNSFAGADTIVAELGDLPMVPVTVDLLNERGLGIVGAPAFCRSVARGLLLDAAVTHGPADLDVVILTTLERSASWEWAKWLPHTRSGGAPRILASDEQVNAWASAVRSGWERPTRPVSPSHITIVVVDEPTWWRDRTSPLRPLFSDASLPLRYVALTDAAEDVPAACTTVVTSHPDGTVSVDRLIERQRIDDLRPFHASAALALDTARRLAPLDDPDRQVTSESSLPTMVSILDLLGIENPDANTFVERWERSSRSPDVRTPVGIGAHGMVELDLVDDGPHGLIAGTTGAGKSELLRSLISGLAANLAPNDINFVLVDFKGGSAFDACARLPHTVGMVTDLDEHLAGRVLRCLRAELHHRELVLRDAGASDLLEYRRLDGVAPLPRLVLVVDEFASVVAELPEFLPSLVDIAQRGRSLGLHMILATQRPAGVVDNKIKANTNLRIALRVQDDGDSVDVIGTKQAAVLPRRAPGRAYMRLSAGELVEFQSAYSTGTTGDAETSVLDIRPFVIGRELSPMEHRFERARLTAMSSTGLGEHSSDLVRLVAAMSEAAALIGQTEQRQPSPDPLPDSIPLRQFFDDHPGDGVPFALVDLPDEQRQIPAWWAPGVEGSLLVYGIAGAGTSSLLATLALGLAERYSPDDVHLYAIDADSGMLAPLDELPHCGAVIRFDEPERLARLARHLGREIDRRKALAVELGGPQRVVASEPTIVVMIDNLGGVRQLLDDRRELEGTWDEIERVLRDGRSLGVCAVITAKQERAVPTSLASQIPERLIMRLADPFGYAAFGFRPADVPQFVSGRAVRPDDKAELHVVAPPHDLAVAVGALDLEPAVERPPQRIDPLPMTITVNAIVDASAGTVRGLLVPIGLDTRTAEPALLPIAFGENVFVAGAAGTGRSSALVAVAAAARRADPSITLFGVAPRGGPLAGFEFDQPSEPADVGPWVDRVLAASGRRIVLIDDADRLGGPSFERLAATRDEHVAIVVAGRADDLRSVSHWTKPLQRFRTGVLLRPAPTDGDLLRTSLGARLPRFADHMGYLVDDGELVPILAAIVGEL